MNAHSPAITPDSPGPWNRASYRIPRQIASLLLMALVSAWVLASAASALQLGGRLLALLLAAVGSP
jgi:hypothetical protein